VDGVREWRTVIATILLNKVVQGGMEVDAIVSILAGAFKYTVQNDWRCVPFITEENETQDKISLYILSLWLGDKKGHIELFVCSIFFISPLNQMLINMYFISQFTNSVKSVGRQELITSTIFYERKFKV
jgi:hypothetical protein